MIPTGRVDIIPLPSHHITYIISLPSRCKVYSHLGIVYLHRGIPYHSKESSRTPWPARARRRATEWRAERRAETPVSGAAQPGARPRRRTAPDGTPGTQRGPPNPRLSFRHSMHKPILWVELLLLVNFRPGNRSILDPEVCQFETGK